MIQKINKITSFGIFNEIENTLDYKDFNKMNLFYGLNGSGKSTLSHLYSLLESREIKSRFPKSKWTFTKADGKQITESDDVDPSLNVKVFDKGFIERNLNWNDTIKGILVVSEGKNDEILKLKKKRKEKSQNDLKINEISSLLDGEKRGDKGIIKRNNNFLSDSAKNIKQKFKLIEVDDTYLSNYNKTKIEKSLNSNISEIKKSPLTDLEIKKLSQTIKPQEKDIIRLSEVSDLSEVTSNFDKIKAILNCQITSEIIESLKNDSKKSDWVKSGLEFHQENDECSFCGNVLTVKRISKLNNHFSDSFIRIQEQISTVINWINNFKTIDFPSFSFFYEEYQDDYKMIFLEFKVEIDKLIGCLTEWKKVLEMKSSNPFERPEVKLGYFDIKNLENLYLKYKFIIDNHNKKHLSAFKIKQDAKDKLEIEYIKSEIKRYDYYKLKEKEFKIIKERNKLQELGNKLKEDIHHLNSVVSTEALGASRFNDDLWKFLGRKDIALDAQSQGGYKIQRNGSSHTEGSQLSEGEKMAIAFVYFINKISENDNKISDTIIVVDDPISSFDSNNLFSSYSYLKLHCNEAKQLFVLTHNFNYYRLVRDWFDTKNKSQKRKHIKDATKASIICNVYSIESVSQSNHIRSSIIKNADLTLLDYSSEYHYLFKKLVDFSREGKLDLDKAYLSANASRKILETFLKFKYPKKSNDFKQLLIKATKNTSFKDNDEYIYRFINKYSHAQDFDNDSSDNKLSEGTNVTKDILNLIKEIDESHYNEMIDVCQN